MAITLVEIEAALYGLYESSQRSAEPVAIADIVHLERIAKLLPHLRNEFIRRDSRAGLPTREVGIKYNIKPGRVSQVRNCKPVLLPHPR